MKTWHMGASTGIRHIHLNIIQIHKIKDRKQDEEKKGGEGEQNGIMENTRIDRIRIYRKVRRKGKKKKIVTDQTKWRAFHQKQRKLKKINQKIVIYRLRAIRAPLRLDLSDIHPDSISSIMLSSCLTLARPSLHELEVSNPLWSLLREELTQLSGREK